MKRRFLVGVAFFVLLTATLLPAYAELGLPENLPSTLLHSPSPEIHQGDLVLTGNNVTTIEGRFDINGSIIVEENATLILKNAVLNFTQTYNRQHNMTFRNLTNGNPRLQVENATITASNYYLKVYFYDNSSASVYDLDTPKKIVFCAYDSSFMSISNSTIEESLYAWDSSAVNVSDSFIELLFAGGSSVVDVSNATIRGLSLASGSVDCYIFGLESGFFSFWNYWLDCSVVVASGGYAPEVTLKDSQIIKWLFYFHELSNATISNSTIGVLETSGSSVATASNSTITSLLYTYGYAVVWLVNSSYSSYFILAESKVYVCWYLDVHVVDSIDQDVPSANATATFPNATVAESKLTDPNGWARLTLMEKMMNATGDYPVGNYTITAIYETYTGQQSVNMTGNTEITISLPFIIPEFPTALLLPILIIITTVAAVLTKRQSRKPHNPEIINGD